MGRRAMGRRSVGSGAGRGPARRWPRRRAGDGGTPRGRTALRARTRPQLGLDDGVLPPWPAGRRGAPGPVSGVLGRDRPGRDRRRTGRACPGSTAPARDGVRARTQRIGLEPRTAQPRDRHRPLRVSRRVPCRPREGAGPIPRCRRGARPSPTIRDRSVRLPRYGFAGLPGPPPVSPSPPHRALPREERIVNRMVV